MAWSDYLNEEAYRRFFEKPRFERATEPPRESWLTKAFEKFRTGRELAERAMVEPEIPIVEREKPGPREELTREYRGIVERLQKGEISDEHAEYLWNTAPETVFGNVSAIGLGAGPRLRDIRSFSDIKALGLEAITPVAPPEAVEPLGRVPVVGRALEHEAAALTSPLGLAFTAKFPGITGMMAAGGVTGATAGRRIAGERGEMVGGLAGALAAPIAGPTAARVALRGAKAAPAAGRTALAEAERLIPRARQIVGEEIGGPKPRPKLRADKISDFEIGRDQVVRRGQRTFVVDKTGQRAEVEVASDVMTPEFEANLRRLTPEQQQRMGAEIRSTPFLSAEGRAERLAILEGAKPPAPIETAGPMFERAGVEGPARGHIRLYRGQVGEGPSGRGVGAPKGRVPFTTEKAYAQTFAPEEPLLYLDVPEELATRYRVSLATDEYFIPVEMLKDARRMRVPAPAIAPKPAAGVAGGEAAELAQLRRMTPLQASKKGFERYQEVLDRIAELEARLGKTPAPKPAAQAFREATRRPGAPTREEALGKWRAGYEKPPAAPGAARAGAQPPREPPTRPPTAEAVPPIPGEDPVPKLIQLIKKAKPVRKETEALKTQVRRKQAAAMGKIFERHPGEAPYRAKGVLKGELPSAAFEPPMNLLSEAEMSQLRRQIRTFFEREGGRAFDELGAREALEGILGGKQPTWGEIGTLQAIFGRKLGAALEGKMPPMKRIAREALEIWNLGRTFKASIDQSWHLRQGIRLGPRHIKESVREGIRGMKGLWSQQTYEDSVRFITRGQEQGRMSPNLFAGRVGPGATTMERTEAYISKYSDVIPVVKHTAREYAASGNFVRGAINENLNRTWTQRLGRKLTEQELEWTGRVCNWGLGRGPLPDDFRGLLAGIFFAPGYRTAGPAYYSLLINPKTPGFVRRMVAEELVAWVGTGVGLLTVLELSGVADVEGIDIRKPGRVSSDFGKIRVGDMRFDIWGGSQQQVRAVLGLITGERKTLSTGEIMDVSRKEVVSRYIESGYQPSMGLATSIWTGTDWEGKPLTPGGSIQDLFAPMAVEDIVEAVREEGAKGWIAAPFVHLGVGVWTPDLAGVKVNELTQRYDEEGRHKNEMSSVEFERLAEEYPDLAKARQDQVDEAAIRGSDWAKFTQKREEGDAEFEKGLKDALLNPKGRTWEQMGRELDDHAYEWAIRSDEFYGELDIDPRDDLDRRINAYYAIEMPAFATEEEKSGFFRQREEMLRADPDLAGAIHDHKVLRFVDSDVRRFVDLKWQAGLVANEYYSIPYKSRMPAEQQEQVSQYVRQAEALARMKNLPFRRALMQTGIPQEHMGLAMRYKNLPTNPGRERYWRQHPEGEELYRAFYGPIPLDIPLGIEQPEMAMAGVP